MLYDMTMTILEYECSRSYTIIMSSSCSWRMWKSYVSGKTLAFNSKTQTQLIFPIHFNFAAVLVSDITHPDDTIETRPLGHLLSCKLLFCIVLFEDKRQKNKTAHIEKCSDLFGRFLPELQVAEKWNAHKNRPKMHEPFFSVHHGKGGKKYTIITMANWQRFIREEKKNNNFQLRYLSFYK